MNKEQKEQILEGAERGIELWKRSRPGSGPGEARKAKRDEARPLLQAYFTVKSWPESLQARVKQVDWELGEL